MTLVAQLQDLRVRAGDPTIRQIERLIARQGRERPMARSTIQDKLSGKSPVNLPEVLSIVEALAEHARLSGTPLLPQEIDQGVWRERVITSTRQTAKSPPLPSPSPVSPTQGIPWDTEALKLAQMHDLIEIVESSSSTPTASWLPSVIAAMLLAEMSVTEFMKRAAEDSPQDVVQTLVALDQAFPAPEPDPFETPDPWFTSANSRTVGALLSHVARKHGTNSTPAIVVAMRRAQIGEHVDAYLSNIARLHAAISVDHIVHQLRKATLSADAERILKLVGSKRRVNRIFEVALRFHATGQTEDAQKILQAVAADNWYRIESVVEEIRDHESAETFVREILRGIPFGKHSEYAQGIERRGNQALAQRVLEAADEPPF
ncbi:hypothetical protein ACFC00_30030 [Streptomyces adustus]|uniref:hypothetical protein n=1 Tax=Streptomyces adustus TaxID=1609272 RepID=UPI0035DC855A